MKDDLTDEWRERVATLVESMPGDDDLGRYRAALLLLLEHGGRVLGAGITCQAVAVALAGLSERPTAITILQPDGTSEVYDAVRGHLRASPDGEITRAEFARSN